MQQKSFLYFNSYQKNIKNNWYISLPNNFISNYNLGKLFKGISLLERIEISKLIVEFSDGNRYNYEQFKSSYNDYYINSDVKSYYNSTIYENCKDLEKVLNKFEDLEEFEKFIMKCPIPINLIGTDEGGEYVIMKYLESKRTN